jgi:ATP-dependent protease ClpP protease subunit
VTAGMGIYDAMMLCRADVQVGACMAGGGGSSLACEQLTAAQGQLV